MKSRKGEKTCYLCGAEKYEKRPGMVRDMPLLDVLQCSTCGLVYLSSFEHVTHDFYEKSGMHSFSPDVDAWIRETSNDDSRRFDFLRKIMESKSILDFGCGNGGFLMLAKKSAKMVTGIEPDQSVEEYFKKQGLVVHKSIGELSDNYDVITMFHVTEHLPEPAAELYKLSLHLNPGGQLIVEVPNAEDALLSLYKNVAFSFFTYWSCHLYYFNEKTLGMLAEKAGLKVNYIKQVQRYPLSNHLHWLALGKPRGHQAWSFLDSPELNSAYQKQLEAIRGCDTIIASLSREEG